MNVRSKLIALWDIFVERYLALTVFTAITALIITFMSGLMIFDTQIVINDGDTTRRFLSDAETVDEILDKSGILLGEYDTVSFAANGISNDISEITINRAFEVPVTADGKTVSVYATEFETVGLVLDRAGITLGEDDLVNLDTSSLISEGKDIVVRRVERVVEKKVTAIPYETENIISSFYKRGTENVVTAGVEGELTTTAENTYIDGKLASFNIISSETTLEPVTEVIATGTAKRTPYSTAKEVELDENGIPVSFSEVLTGKATAYSAGQYARGASGKSLYVGTVAVNPDIIPYGTEMYIVSTDGSVVYGHAVAADTGLALMDGRVMVDVFMDSYSSSCRWGAHQVNIYILD